MQVTATEAKNNFGAVLDALSSGVVEVIKNGKVAAYILSPTEFQAMAEGHKSEQLRAKIAASDSNVLSILGQYSRGALPKDRAMRMLEIRSQAQLLDALGAANLPLPSVPSETLQEMVRDIRNFLEGSS